MLLEIRMCCCSIGLNQLGRVNNLIRKITMSEQYTNDRDVSGLPGGKPNGPTGIYYNAIHFVFENSLQLGSAEEIAAELMNEMGAFGNGLIESEIRRIACAITSNRWPKAWLF